VHLLTRLTLLTLAAYAVGLPTIGGLLVVATLGVATAAGLLYRV
jgi:hypothetical protein